MALAKIKRVLAVAVLSSIAFAVYAEDAPVYEVDNYPPAFDGQSVDAPSSNAPDSANGGGMASDASTPSLPPPVTYAAPTESSTPAPRPLTFEQRIHRAEQQIKNLQQSSSLAKADDLQKEVQALRGQVEEISHQLQQAQGQLKVMYADLDKRLSTSQIAKPILANKEGDIARVSEVKSASKLSGKSPLATPKAVDHQQPNAAEEQQIYQTAYDLIKAKKYNDAIATLQKMLQKYPSGQTAANAHYWLGELYGLLGKNEQSASEFSMVVKKYPTSPKVPDAQLKLGLIYAGLFKWTEAKAAFKGVVSRSPGTASARLATEQLKQIKKAGH